jgi:hypothetical protein
VAWEFGDKPKTKRTGRTGNSPSFLRYHTRKIVLKLSPFSPEPGCEALSVKTCERSGTASEADFRPVEAKVNGTGLESAAN